MSFKIQSKVKNSVGMISIDGEVDMFTSPSLRERLLPLFKKNMKGIIVDLSNVSFMDSSGIATLVEGLQWSKKHKKKFILTGLDVNVKNALALTKLDNIFDIKTDAGEVYKKMSQS